MVEKTSKYANDISLTNKEINPSFVNYFNFFTTEYPIITKVNLLAKNAKQVS